MTSRDKELRDRNAPIDMTPDVFREVGHRLVDDIAEFMASIPNRPVNYDESPSQIRALLPDASIPNEGTAPDELMREVAPLLFDHSLLNGHPRFMAYITSSPAPIGVLADMLSAAVNPNVGGWQLSPMASEIEKQCVTWIAELIGFPKVAGGLFVSGGNMANFVCFLAARQAKATWDVRKRGLDAGDGTMLVYGTGETHTWIQKALDLFGFGTDAIRTIPHDEHLCADVKALRTMIEDDRHRGDHPFLLIGSAGTVSTGAIDPLGEMAAVAREYGLWFHVDGAYGALAAALPEASERLKALSDADSVAVDPHKWLYSPLEAGCVLVRDPSSLPAAFSYTPSYYHFESEDEPKTNFYEYGLQNSRGFRALKTWLGIRQVGRTGYVRMISDDIFLAGELYRLANEHPELEAFTHSLSITTFRYVPEGLQAGTTEVETYLNELNEALLTKLKTSGELFLSNAVVNGTFLLRACVVNFRTSLGDMEKIPPIILDHGRALDGDLRPSALR